MSGNANIGDATLDVRASLTSLNKNLATAEAKSKASVGRMNKIMTGLKVGAAAGGVAVAGIGAAALSQAKDFDKGIREVNTLIGGDANFLKQLKADTLDFSEEMGITTDQVVPAMYQAISSGVPPDNIFAFMRESAKAAIGGSAELADVIAVGTSIAKGYGMEMSEVNGILDQLQNVVKLGVTTMPELAASMGKVVPLASALGIDLEEVNGAMATLTGVTGNTAEVSTQLRATYQAILKPTKEMGSALQVVAADLKQSGVLTGAQVDEYERLQKQMGYAQTEMNNLEITLKKLQESEGDHAEEIRKTKALIKEQGSYMKDLTKDIEEQGKALGPAIVEAVGFEEALALLGGTADGNTAELGKMFGSVEAINAVLALTGPQAENFTAKLGAMGEAGGSVDAAFNEMEGSLDRQYETFKNQLSVVMIEFGEKILPAVSRLLTEVLMPAFKQLTDWYEKNEDSINHFFVAIWQIAQPIVQAYADIWQNAVLPAIRELKAAWDAAFPSSGEGPSESLQTLITIAKILGNILKFGLKNAIKIITFTLKALITTIGWLVSLPDQIAQAWESLKTAFSNTLSFIESVVKGYVNAYIWAFNTLIRAINSISVQVPDWVPGIGGKGFSPNLPEIPMLAKGGLVQEPTLAMLGEAGPEAVIPLDRMGSGRPIQVIFQGDVYGIDEFNDKIEMAVNQAHRRGLTL